MYVLEEIMQSFGTTRSFRIQAGTMIRRNAIALVCVGAALVSTLLLQHLFSYPFLFLFFAAVMTHAWVVGAEPGPFAVLVSTLAVHYFFFSPFLSLVITAPGCAAFVAFIP